MAGARILRAVVLTALVALVAYASQAEARSLTAGAPGAMTLSVSPVNPRYFVDETGRLVYLTGSHNWSSLVDRGYWYPPPRFNFTRYLDLLERNGHNFIRMWTWEIPKMQAFGRIEYSRPQPWLRTGPGRARDGLLKFDLRRYDPEYFRRLRARVAAARARGIYVSVMLFEGWGLQFAERPWNWRSHPLNGANNVNGVNGDVNRDGRGNEIHTLESPRVFRTQRAFVRRVIRTVGAFDNVLYEIANESSSAYSTAWQYRMIYEVRSYESYKGWWHPIGMTFQHAPGDNAALLASAAEWISPGGAWYLTDPPATDGAKVSLSDTDHHCGVCGDADFAWRSFTRGHNPIFMDYLGGYPAHVAARRALGDTRRLADRIDLGATQPRPDLTSTGFALAAPGSEYVVYQPGSGPFDVNLTDASGSYAVEWVEVSNGTTSAGPAVVGGGWRTLTPPFSGRAVVHLERI
jgi:hypothetical protein